MKCKLCQEKVSKLCESHIITETFYDKVYDEKHRFKPITADNFRNAKFMQKGYKENLLCPNCETKLSKIENITKKTLEDIGKQLSSDLKFTKLTDDYFLVEGIRYNEVKQCILSLIWRMGISKLPEFSLYDLGPYEEKLRYIIDKQIYVTTKQYPIFIKKVLVNGTYYPDILMTMNRSKIKFFNTQYILQSFIIYGFIIEIIMKENFKSKDIEVVLLQDNGMLPIGNFNLLEPDEIDMSKLIKRFHDNDIRDFYKTK